MSGIVSFDICAVFETQEEMKKTYGIYAKPIKPKSNEDLIEIIYRILTNFQNEAMTIDEYCISEYDNKKMKLIKYSENIWKQWQPAKEQAKLKWIKGE